MPKVCTVLVGLEIQTYASHLFTVTEMLLAVLSVCSEEELTEADIDSTGEVEIRTELPPMSEDIQRRRQEIKNKILAVGKVQRMFQVLRSVLFLAGRLFVIC